MDNNFLMSTLPVVELKEMIRLVLREEIKEVLKSQTPEKLISGDVARKVFEPEISHVTLIKWVADGRIKQYQIGGRKYYKANEIIEAAKHLKKYKKS